MAVRTVDRCIVAGPKVPNPSKELHAHINGSISNETIKKLLQEKGREDEAEQLRFQRGQTATLEDCFKKFKLIHTISDSADAVYMITCDVIKEFAEENVKYLELRSTPREITCTGLTRKSYVEAVLTAIQDSSHLDIMVKFLLSIDRRLGLDVAKSTVELARQYRDISQEVVIGVDLSGDPKVGDAREYVPVLSEAHKAGLKLALHLAEVPAPEETFGVMEKLGRQIGRIGHGTCLQMDSGGSQALVDLVLQNNIPLELCLTSNVIGQTVPNFDQHQFQFWYDKGHPCIICTDDKGVFNTSLSEEYAIAARTFGLSREMVWQLSLSSIEAIFSDESIKSTLRKKWQEIKPKLKFQ